MCWGRVAGGRPTGAEKEGWKVLFTWPHCASGIGGAPHFHEEGILLILTGSLGGRHRIPLYR